MERLLSRRAELIEAGAKPIGWKLAFGSPAVHEPLGLGGPVVGFLTDATLLAPGGTCAVGDWTTPKLEPELAIHVGAPVDPGAGAGVAAAAIRPLGGDRAGRPRPAAGRAGGGPRQRRLPPPRRPRGRHRRSPFEPDCGRGRAGRRATGEHCRRRGRYRRSSRLDRLRRPLPERVRRGPDAGRNRHQPLDLAPDRHTTEAAPSARRSPASVPPKSC